MGKHKIIEDVKNTNYKMHKSKKGWIVSYSLLTLMLGGLASNNTFLTQKVAAADLEIQNNQEQSPAAKNGSQDNNSSTQKLKASEVKPQNTPSQDNSGNNPAQELATAKENAQRSLKAEADKVKHDISYDNKLSKEQKEEQLQTVDATFNKAKAEIDQATTLVDVKVLVANETLSINSCHKTVPAKTVINQNKKTTSKNKKVVSHKAIKQHPTATNKNKKSKLTSYSRLNSFFKSGSVKSATKAVQINKSVAPMAPTAAHQNTAQTKNIALSSATSKEVTTSNLPKNTNLSAASTPNLDNTAVDTRSINNNTVLKDSRPLKPTLAADNDNSKDITVAPDAVWHLMLIVAELILIVKLANLLTVRLVL